jgi:hypothetical protein
LFVSYCYFTVSYILILLSPRWFVGNPNIFQVAHQQNILLFNSICFFGYSFSWKSSQDFFTANSMEEIKKNLDSIITMYDCVLLFSVLWSFWRKCAVTDASLLYNVHLLQKKWFWRCTIFYNNVPTINIRSFFPWSFLISLCFSFIFPYFFSPLNNYQWVNSCPT